MTQADRDRLIALKKAHQKLITQREAAAELGLSVRQVQRLLEALDERGDQAVIHGLRGRVSNRKTDPRIVHEAVEILAAPLYQGFGPTLAAEYLASQHGITASKETVRQWMIAAKLWRGKKQKIQQIHTWRPRRSRWGELVQWDSSPHDWLEGRGDRLCLIAMIDDATSRLWARFARHDSTAENMRLLWSYLEKFGRPLTFYTDKASIFQTAPKSRRGEWNLDNEWVETPLTQIGRALRELGIGWQAAHSPQAKGRVERNFGTAQDRLVKGLRVAGVTTLDEANQYLNEAYLVWWERELTVEAANSEDAHRPLDDSHDLAASLSQVEARQVRNDYTLRWEGKLYRIERQAVVAGLRGAKVRVEKRLDGSLAVRHGERYLAVQECGVAENKPPLPAPSAKPAAPRKTAPKPGPQPRASDWNKNFDLNKGPKLWQAAQASGYRPSTE